MPFDCNPPADVCIYQLGLAEALEHKWLQSQRYGEDLGLIGVRDWCQRHWKTFQRFRRVDHLFGDSKISQFTDVEPGIWRGRIRNEGDLFELVLGAFVCGMENLEFVNWVRERKLPRHEADEAYELFTTLDPNCARLDYLPIIHRAKTLLVVV